MLSRAYLRDVQPETDMLVAHVEAERNLDSLGLPLQREPGIDLPLRFRMCLVVDASRAELWGAALAQVRRAVGVECAPIGRPPPCPYRDAALRERAGGRLLRPGRRDRGRDQRAAPPTVRGGHRAPPRRGSRRWPLAGVAPRLRQHGLDGGEGWHVEIMRVGPEPVAELGPRHQAMAGGAGRPPAAARRRPARGAVRLGHRRPPGVRGALAALLDDHDIHVVVTVRRLLPQPDVRPPVAARQQVPGRGRALTGHGLREAIRAPARARRVVVAEALVERLAAETEGQPGLLPFLQETLVTLWARSTTACSRSRPTPARATGPGRRPCSRRFAGSPRRGRRIEAGHPGAERLVRNILVSLVQFGEGRPDTRRQVPVADLAGAAPDSQAVFDPVFATLVERRLVTVDRGADGTLVADLSHEAIIRGWPTLGRWIEEDQAAEAARRRLHAEAEEWRSGRPGATRTSGCCRASTSTMPGAGSPPPTTRAAASSR